MRCVYFIWLIILWGCNTNTSKDTTLTVSDTVGVVPDSTAGNDAVFTSSPGDSSLFGFYQGLLPCKDCEGIKHTLLLKDSGRFKLEEFTLGRNTFPQKKEGRWIKKGDSLRLMANQKLILTYHIEKDTLRVGYREGSSIPDSVAKSYWIARQPDASMNAAWRKKAQSGVDLHAVGNEPFWSLEIDHERSISFRIADLPKPVVFPVRQPVIDKDSTYYSVDSAGSKLEVTVYNEFCSDGMSDNMYEYRVHVRYKGETFKGCGVYFRK